MCNLVRKVTKIVHSHTTRSQKRDRIIQKLADQIIPGCMTIRSVLSDLQHLELRYWVSDVMK